MKQKQIINNLKMYFKKQPGVVLAFLFGSRAKDKRHQHLGSDWDIGAYFKPYEYMEIETRKDYPAEKGMWGELVNICQSNDVDLINLNRAKPSLVFTVLSKGIPLAIKDRKMYLDLFSKTHYEALDWRQFVFDFYSLKEKASSLNQKTKENILDYLDFLEEEFRELEKFRKFGWDDYRKNSLKRKAIERWVENIVMASIDIAKIILASDKRRMPQTYQQGLKDFVAFYIKTWDEETADTFSDFAQLRNIVLHEYLDIKWERIKKFIKQAEKLYPQFIKTVKRIIKEA